MASVKMIVTDLDNTLPRKDKTISDFAASVLNRCKKRGIRIAFATARPERVTRRFQTLITPDCVIADNGAVIICNGAVIRRLAISRDTGNRFIRTAVDCHEITCMTAETGHCLFTNYNGSPWDPDWEAWKTIYTDFSAELPEEVTKISIECGRVDLVKEIIQGFPELHLYSNYGEHWHQVMCRDATKIKAVSFIADEFGIDLRDIVAFGDDYNDVDLLRGCGVGVAVANAQPEAKTAANEICYSNDCDGVALWLEKKVL